MAEAPKAKAAPSAGAVSKKDKPSMLVPLIAVALIVVGVGMIVYDLWNAPPAVPEIGEKKH